MALLETLHRADTRLSQSFRQAAETVAAQQHVAPEAAEESLFKSLFAKVADNVSSGASAVGGSFTKLSTKLGDKASDVAAYFRGISNSGSEHSAADLAAQLHTGVADEVESSGPTISDQQTLSAGGASFTEQTRSEEDVEGIYGVHYSKYPIASYVKLPAALQPFVNLPWLDHYLVVAKPTMDKSGGLRGYREVVPKSVRAAAPFIIIVDVAGQLEGFQDKNYLWYEFKLVDVFKLDVRGMKNFDDYLAKLSKKARWNCKDRQKKLKASPLKVEYVALPKGERELLDTLWPLYKKTGEKNGFCVLGEKEFYDFHMNTPDLTVMMIKDTSKDDQLVTFCTGVRSGDVLMPMWCGTDYDHELAMKCSTYFNMLYEYFRVAIEDPGINWVDLGATRRTAKTGIGCEGYPVNGYVRCKNSVMVALVETMMKEYFNPEELMNDP